MARIFNDNRIWGDIDYHFNDNCSTIYCLMQIFFIIFLLTLLKHWNQAIFDNTYQLTVCCCFYSLQILYKALYLAIYPLLTTLNWSFLNNSKIFFIIKIVLKFILCFLLSKQQVLIKIQKIFTPHYQLEVEN